MSIDPDHRERMERDSRERAAAQNVGHGHVRPRPDGVRTRCGGPGNCTVCNREAAAAAPTCEPPRTLSASASVAISKQVAARMTGHGFDNSPMGCRLTVERDLSSVVYVVRLDGIAAAAPVFALVLFKGHVPQEAHHVLDYRIGSDIYR